MAFLRRAAAGLGLALLLAGCTPLYFHPMERLVLDPAEHGIDYEDVWFESADGEVRLHGWFLPATTEPRGTVLFLHGNAENISTHIAAAWWLTRHELNVFLIDYRGFGRSEGRPDFPGVHQDALGALTWLRDRDDIPADRIVLFGQSLGGAVAITTAGLVVGEDAVPGVELQGVVADSPFGSYPGIARDKMRESWVTWPFSWVPSLTVRGDFDPLDYVGRISPVPLLLVVAAEDVIIPPHHSQELYEQAGEPRRLIRLQGLGHNQTTADPAFREQLVDWIHARLAADPDS